MKRLRLYPIHFSGLLNILRAYKLGDSVVNLPIPINIPETARIVSIHPEHVTRTLDLTVEDDSFSVVPDGYRLPIRSNWPYEMREVQLGPVANFPKPSEDEVAGAAWEAGRESVGYRGFNGEPLPTWSELRADTSKEKIANGWLAVARSLREKGYLR